MRPRIWRRRANRRSRRGTASTALAKPLKSRLGSDKEKEAVRSFVQGEFKLRTPAYEGHLKSEVPGTIRSYRYDRSDLGSGGGVQIGVVRQG